MTWTLTVVRKGIEQHRRTQRVCVLPTLALASIKIKEVRPVNKKENRMAVRQEVQKSVIRDEQNRRIQFAATNPINEVLKNLHLSLIHI